MTQNCPHCKEFHDSLLPLSYDAPNYDERVFQALATIEHYGGIDGEHHKTWVIDQVARTLLGERYDEWVKAINNGKDGPDTYEWNTGITP